LCHNYETMHKEKFNNLEDKFNILKLDLQWQQNIFTVAKKSSEAVV